MLDSGIVVVNAFGTIQSRLKYQQDTRLFVSSQEENGEENNGMMMNRRSVMIKSGLLSTSLVMGLPQINYAVEDEEDTRMFASWSAVDGLNSELEGVVTFDPSAYKAMKEDSSRTPLFKQAIIDRLYSSSSSKSPESQIVLDLGTGPYALFAIIAAEAGAGKVYAVEANPEAARLARALVTKLGFNDVITILEGFSTDIPSLPNNDKADFCVAEIIGSIATEEGAYATIRDAQRFLKDPSSPQNWIPSRIQTYAAPASYTLHNLFGPPEFDWSKLNGTPVRFSCRDEGLQLLSEPQLVEDVSFANLGSSTTNNKTPFTFIMDETKMEANQGALEQEFQMGKLSKSEAMERAKDTSHSVSGIAFWPRLILSDSIIVNSRQYPNGNHQRSHWQTVLPIMSNRPIGNLKTGDSIQVNFDFITPESVSKPPKYTVSGKVIRK